MNKQELIRTLKEQEWQFENSLGGFCKGLASGYRRSAELAEQLDEPKKVTVPKFVAEFYETNKNDLDFAIYEAVVHSIKEADYKIYPEGFIDWFCLATNNPIETLIRMKDGYEIEKEPLYLMPVPYISYPVHYCVDDDGKVSYRQGNAQKFTQTELDKYFPDIKQFAVPFEEVAK